MTIIIFTAATLAAIAIMLAYVGGREVKRSREEAASRHRHPTSRKLKML